jgi:DNA-binding response OmpR family regulator
MHIGILEDNGPIAEILTIALEAAGYTVSSHVCGSPFLAALFSHPQLYDLAILDLCLPDMSGMDVLTTIRHRYAIPVEQLPLIVISAHDGALADVLAHFPSVPVFHKPFSLTDVLQTIARLTANHKPQQVHAV